MKTATRRQTLKARAPTAVVVASILGSFTACGEEATESAKGFEGEEQRIAQVVEDFERATTERDARRVCADIYAPEVRRALDRQRGPDCQQQVKASAKPEAKDFDYRVTGVRVEGSNATARVEAVNAGKRKRAELTLAKQEGRWGIVPD